MSQSRPARLALTLAAVAGFVDAACYLTLHRLFVAHVSGDANLFGQHLGRGDLGGAVPLAVAVGFFAASVTAATVGMELATRRRWPSPLALALVVEAMLLAFLMCYGGPEIREGTIPGHAVGGYYLLLFCAVSAMGVQTAALTKAGQRTVRTTYISGMTTRFAQELANLLLPPPSWECPSYTRDTLGLNSRRCSLRGALLYAGLAVCFMIGAVAAVYAVLRIDLWALTFPVAALVLLTASLVWPQLRHQAMAVAHKRTRFTASQQPLAHRELDRP